MALKGHRRRHFSDTVTAKRALYYQMPSVRCELPGMRVYLCCVSKASWKTKKQKHALELKHTYLCKLLVIEGNLTGILHGLKHQTWIFSGSGCTRLFAFVATLCWYLKCDMLTVHFCEKYPKTTTTKNVSTLNSVFYWTSCGSLQIHHLQTHDLYATHTEDHVGKKNKTIGKSLCTETNNKLPLTQFCCRISWLLCDCSVLVHV